jgi:hypothetical protein
MARVFPRKLAIHVSAVALAASAACAEHPARAASILDAKITSCEAVGSDHVVRVAFGTNPATPSVLLSRLNRLSLLSFTYSVEGSAASHEVGRLPSSDGTIDLDPSDEDESASAVPLPPPAADLHVQSTDRGLVFSNLALAETASVSLSAGSLKDIEGTTVDTPVGRVILEEARYADAAAVITLRYEFTDEILADEGVRALGAIESTLSYNGYDPVGSVPSFVPLGSRTQELNFFVGTAGPPRELSLSLLQFGYLVRGPIRARPASACT